MAKKKLQRMTPDRTLVGPLTPELLARLTALPPVIGDRPLDMAHVEYLRVSTEKILKPFIISVGRLDGKHYRVDGQHSIELLRTTPELASNAEIVLQEYTCNSYSDLADLVATNNDRNTVRSQYDLNALAAAGSSVALRGIVGDNRTNHKSTLATLTSALVHRERGFGQWSQCKGRERAAVLGRHEEFVLWVLRFHDVLTRERKKKKLMVIKRAPVIAAMHAEWLLDPTATALFWFTIVYGAGLFGEAQDFRDYLSSTKRRFLMGRAPAPRKNEKGKAIRKGVQSIETAPELFARCITIWNHYAAAYAAAGLKLSSDIEAGIYNMKNPDIKAPRRTLKAMLDTLALGQDHLIQRAQDFTAPEGAR
jgi:hypothetical protein